jgi:hypothetical protein
MADKQRSWLSRLFGWGTEKKEATPSARADEPLQAKDPWQVILQTDCVPIRDRNPAIPARLAEVIDQALIDRPQIHFKSAAELRTALEAAA